MEIKVKTKIHFYFHFPFNFGLCFVFHFHFCFCFQFCFCFCFHFRFCFCIPFRFHCFSFIFFSTLIPCIPTLIPRIPIIPTLIPHIPIIPFIPLPDSLFRLLQIAVSLSENFAYILNEWPLTDPMDKGEQVRLFPVELTKYKIIGKFLKIDSSFICSQDISLEK